MDIELFRKRIKALRGKYSQEKMAQIITEKTHISITAQTLGRYENGKRTPDITIFEALAKAYNVSTDYLLGLSDVKSPDTDTQAVCNFTGLSEKALKRLCEIKGTGKIILLNRLLESENMVIMGAD